MADTFPPLTCSDVLACRFSSWYPAFRKHSPKASIIKPLEDRFIDYLESDRVFIPDGSGPMGVSELSDGEDDESGSDFSEDPTEQIKFSELDAQIRRVITKYDGAVFPKLNWSSPQDAAWMLPGSTLKCQSPADVYLLLKSSDFISHDLDHAFDSCIDYTPPLPSSAPLLNPDDQLAQSTNELRLDDDSDDIDSIAPAPRSQPRAYDFELVLKKWFEMPRAQEWRCFVRDRTLIALCQRDTNYYDFLQGQEAHAEIRAKVVAFFEDEVRNVFPLTSYTFDVYFTRSNERVFLIDFNPFAPQTDALLFSWSALNEIVTSDDPASPRTLPLLELVDSSTMASQSLPSYSHNRYPKDVVDLSSGASIAEFAQKWRGALTDGLGGSDDEGSVGSAKSTRSAGSRERIGR